MAVWKSLKKRVTVLCSGNSLFPEFTLARFPTDNLGVAQPTFLGQSQVKWFPCANLEQPD